MLRWVDYLTRRFRYSYTDEAQHYRGLAGKVKNHLVTMKGFAGKSWVLVFMWMPLGTHHFSPARKKNHRTKTRWCETPQVNPKRFCAHASTGQSQVRFTAGSPRSGMSHRYWSAWHLGNLKASEKEQIPAQSFCTDRCLYQCRCFSHKDLSQDITLAKWQSASMQLIITQQSIVHNHIITCNDSPHQDPHELSKPYNI